MRRFLLAIGLVFASATSSAHAAEPVSITILGPKNAVEGLDFGSDPETGRAYDAVHDTENRQVTVTLPDGRSLTANSRYTSVDATRGWVTGVTLRPAWNHAMSPADMGAYVDAALGAFGAKLDGEQAKRWAAWKKTPSHELEMEIVIGNFVGLEVELRPGDKNGQAVQVKIFTDPGHGKESNPPPGEPAVLTGAGRGRGVAFAPDGKTIVVGATFYETATGEAVGKVKLDGTASVGPFSPDGKLIAYESRKGILLVDAATREVAAPLSDEKHETGRPIGFSPDGETLYVLSKRVVAWSVADRKVVREFDPPQGEVASAALSPDGKLMALGNRHGSTATLWDTATGKQVAKLQPVTKGFERGQHADHLQFTPDGGRLIVSGFMGSFASIYDVAGRKFVGPVQLSGGQHITLSPDGRSWALGTWLTMTEPNGVYVHDAKTLEIRAALRPFSGVFREVVWSPDGRHLAAWKSDGDVVLLFETAKITR